MTQSCQDKEFIVYCHTNKINNKKYIGITCQEPEQRFRHGKGYKASPHFYHAIEKYGWDQFEHETLYSGLTIDEAKEKEIELIKKYNTRDENFGYNITPGGEGYCGEDSPWFGRHHTEEAKAKMSAARKGVPKPESMKKKLSERLKSRTFSEETRRKMSENHPDVSGEKNPMYGKKMDPEHQRKMVIASKTPEAIEKMKQNKTWNSGAENPNAKRVICIETGKIYGTMNEAAADNGCTPSKVSAVCHGHMEHTHHLHFKILEKE